MFPLVSILIPTYNRPHYLDECLASVLTQDYKNLEIVIRDDASSVDISSIIKKYKNLFNLANNYKYARNNKNIGYMQNMLEGFKNDCMGKYVMILNDDDFFITNKIVGIFVNTLETIKDISFVYSKVYSYEQSKELKMPMDIIRSNMNRQISQASSIVDGNEYFLNFWTKYDPICWASIMFKRDLAIEREWEKSDCRDQGIAHLLSINKKVMIYLDKFAAYRLHEDKKKGISNYLKRCSPERCLVSHKSIAVWIECARKISNISQLSLFIWRLKAVLLKDEGPIRYLYAQSEFKLYEFLRLVKEYNYLHYLLLRWLSPQIIKYDSQRFIENGNKSVAYKIMLFIRKKVSDAIIKIDRWMHDPEIREKRIRGEKRKCNVIVYNKASLLQKKGISKKAEYLFKKVIIKSEEIDLISGAYFHLGEIRYNNKKYRSAKNYLTICIQTCPEHNKAKEYLKLIEKTPIQ